MTTKKAIFTIMETLDENKEKISNGDYLKMSDALQEIYDKKEYKFDETGWNLIIVIVVILGIVFGKITFEVVKQSEFIHIEQELKATNYGCFPAEVRTEYVGNLVLFNIIITVHDRNKQYIETVSQRPWCYKNDGRCINEIFKDYVQLSRICRITFIKNGVNTHF